MSIGTWWRLIDRKVRRRSWLNDTFAWLIVKGIFEHIICFLEVTIALIDTAAFISANLSFDSIALADATQTIIFFFQLQDFFVILSNSCDLVSDILDFFSKFL